MSECNDDEIIAAAAGTAGTRSTFGEAGMAGLRTAAVDAALAYREEPSTDRIDYAARVWLRETLRTVAPTSKLPPAIGGERPDVTEFQKAFDVAALTEDEARQIAHRAVDLCTRLRARLRQ